MIHELEHWIKYCKTDSVKDMIQRWIMQCNLNTFKYCNFIQAELLDTLWLNYIVFADRYWQTCRDMLEEWEWIDRILLHIIDKEWSINEKKSA
jgi:ADP-glucose pyrophosphorylase